MYLLDTDVLSQATKIVPKPLPMAWLARVDSQSLFLSVISIQEVRSGIEALDAGPKRRELERWLADDLLVRFANRILTVDVAVAQACGRIVSQARRRNKNPALSDALIAATAQVKGFAVATLNVKDFEGLGVELVEF